MAGNTRVGGVRERVFTGWAPRVGVMCLATLDTGARPFLPVALDGEEVGGWLFLNPALDDTSIDLRVRGFSAGDRRAPCYCKFARTRLSQV